jgi:aryl-alcohol dehydrogenase-like predicted oxidoreductase
MRYRPFGDTGKSVSALSMALRPSGGLSTVQSWRNLIFSGMENGINCFDLAAGYEELETAMGEALQAVDRRLIFLIWSIRGDPRRPLSAQALADTMRQALKRTGARYFDVLMLDETAVEGLTPPAMAYVQQLRSAGFALQLGVCGDGPVSGRCLEDPAFDVLATPYNLTSEWKARRLLREAAGTGMVTIGYNVAPAEMLQPPRPEPGVSSILRRVERHPLSGAGTYAFLHNTPRWTPEELCLAYALTEPALATLQIDLELAGKLEALAAVPERDPPTGLGAQIEMARFGAEPLPARKRA